MIGLIKVPVPNAAGSDRAMRVWQLWSQAAEYRVDCRAGHRNVLETY